MDALFALFGLVVEQPWLALLPAAFLAVLACFTRSRVVWVVTSLWVVYSVYEFGVSIRLLCSGECNIRVDLLLFAPLLVLLTLVACVAAGRKMRSPREKRG